MAYGACNGCGSAFNECECSETVRAVRLSIQRRRETGKQMKMFVGHSAPSESVRPLPVAGSITRGMFKGMTIKELEEVF